MNFLKTFFYTILVLVLVAATGFSTAITGIASAKEVTLRMLIWDGYAPEHLQKQFISMIKEKYGVDLKLNIKFCKANDDFFPAIRSDKADIISPSNNIPKDKRFKFIEKNMVLPLNLELIPNYNNILPALQKASYGTEGGKVYLVPHVRGPYGLAYNTSLVKEPPESWNALWDPKYKNKYAIGGDGQYMHNVSVAALALGVDPDKIYDHKTLNNPEVRKKVTDLAVNAHAMWEGVDDAKTLKGLSLAVVWGFSLPELKEMGEVWKIAEPKEGTTGWVDNFMISQSVAKDPMKSKIAHEWLNFVLSDEYQVYDVRGLACAPVTTTVKNKLTQEEIERLHLDDPTHFQRNRILWKTLDKRDRNFLKLLWSRAVNQR